MIDQQIDIVFNNPLNSDTFLMGLQSPLMAEDARPGQFVMVRVRSGLDPFLRRPFSICGTKGDVFHVLYRVVGKGTAMMAEMKTGDRMSVLGPLGRGFDIPEKDNRCVLVAGGLGAAPLCFLAQKIRPERFMVGYASSSAIIPLDHILGNDQHTSIATDDGTEGHAGQVTDLL
ncbi:MAG: dihydroorotate dehydrogenase electron transfer subunit, partial [Deltaproteobacteria bacterium]|nr:dihydroorotate dehydrogenase electron transfer subunit [Deltaproteobacteria bacterium]